MLPKTTLYSTPCFTGSLSESTQEVWLQPSQKDPISFYLNRQGELSTFITGAYPRHLVTLNAEWTHVAVTCLDGVVTLYVNGVKQASRPFQGIKAHSALMEMVARMKQTTLVDEIRITHGAARYTANFTPQRQIYAQW